MPYSDGSFPDAIAKLDFTSVVKRIGQFALSSPGKEKVAALFPSAIFAEVRDELERVREMIFLIGKNDPPPLDGVSDIRESLHRAAIEGSMLSSESLLHILRLLVACRHLSQYFSKRRDGAVLLSSLAEQIFSDKTLEYHIERVIDESGAVKDSASRELRELRRTIIEQSAHLRRRLESILKKISEEDIVQEELITVRDGRMVLPIKAEFKHAVAGFIHSSSSSGQTVYIEPTETLELNNEIRELEFEEQREVHKLLTELTTRIRPAAGDMLRNVELVAELDSLYARARYAKEFHAECPVVKLNDFLEINFGKHPVLLLHKKYSDVIPLSLSIGETYNTIIITGPNAGGKSVAMKTVGLMCLLVQSGIPIPADETSQFPIYHRIAVDIGDEQSVENDLSTFSSHIQRLVRIIESADEKTLVLIDEIGTGTDPAEGSALGAAILQRLTEARAHVIATTHHGMLKAFADQHPLMQNAAMEFDLTTLEPTYRFRCGLPGSSYAFEITRRHGMDPAIIDRARELLGSQTQSLEHLLSEVEKRSQLLAKQMITLEEEQKKLCALIADYREKNDALRRETKQIKKAAIEEAKGIVASANASLERAIREIREQNASKEIIKKEKQTIESLKQRLAVQSEEEEQFSEKHSDPTIRINDSVTLKDNPSMQGIVLEEPGNGFVLVAFGSIKLRTELNKLVRAEKKGIDATQPVQPVQKIGIECNEIDIRGMYGDEAIRTVDAFLYEAYAAGFKRVDIIHGKGTGALRKRVHEYLSELSFVESFQLADWNEGGSGMTVVMLK